MPRSWTLNDQLGHTLDISKLDGFGRLIPDSNGTFWYADDVDGWDSPAMRAAAVDKAGGQGQLVPSIEYSSRLVTIKGGLAVATTEANRYTAELALETVLRLHDPTAPGALTTHEDIDRSIWVLKTEKFTIQDLPPGPVAPLLPYGWPFRFEVPLLSPDPRKYGASHTLALPSGVATAVTNAGDYPTWPTLTITGGTNGDHITLSGQTVSLSNAYRPIPSPLTVNFQTGAVTDSGGVNAYSVISSDNWFQLIPGANSVTWTGTGTCSISWSDSWI